MCGDAGEDGIKKATHCDKDSSEGITGSIPTQSEDGRDLHGKLWAGILPCVRPVEKLRCCY